MKLIGIVTKMPFMIREIFISEWTLSLSELYNLLCQELPASELAGLANQLMMCTELCTPCCAVMGYGWLSTLAHYSVF